MSLLEKIFTLLIGQRLTESPLNSLFLREPSADQGIVLKETGYPNGGVTTYTWWKSHGSGFYKSSHRGYGALESNTVSEPIHAVGDRVDELFKLLNEEYFDLHNYSRKVRDGVVYVVSWGTKERQRSIVVNTPTVDSRHYQLISKLKENTLL
jgi:hypothetical protein